jgi:hypothetical protein
MRRLLDRATAAAHTAWELDFTEDMTERFEKEGPGVELTDRQWEKLWEIAEGGI